MTLYSDDWRYRYIPIHGPKEISPEHLEHSNRLQTVIKKYKLSGFSFCPICNSYPNYRKDTNQFHQYWKSVNAMLQKHVFNVLANIITSYVPEPYICHFCSLEQKIRLMKGDLNPDNDMIFKDIDANEKDKYINLQYGKGIIKLKTFLNDDDIYSLLYKTNVLMRNSFSWAYPTLYRYHYRRFAPFIIEPIELPKRIYKRISSARSVDISTKKEKKITHHKIKHQKTYCDKWSKGFRNKGR